MPRTGQASSVTMIAILFGTLVLGSAVICSAPPTEKDKPSPTNKDDKPVPDGKEKTQGGKLGGLTPLPDFLQPNDEVLTENDGVRFNGRKYLKTKTSDFFESDFTFSVVYTHKAKGDDLAFVGIGALDKGNYDEPDRSVFLRLHPPHLDKGKIGLTKMASSNQISVGFINDPGTHRVTLEKKGKVIRFAIDVDNNGKSDEDMEKILGDLKTFAPFLSNKNSYLFFGGGALFKEVTLKR